VKGKINPEYGGILSFAIRNRINAGFELDILRHEIRDFDFGRPPRGKPLFEWVLRRETERDFEVLMLGICIC
jgi:hypothetical protein